MLFMIFQDFGEEFVVEAPTMAEALLYCTQKKGLGDDEINGAFRVNNDCYIPENADT